MPSKAMQRVMPKPYVEEDDSYLKPGMKDEKEGGPVARPQIRPVPSAKISKKPFTSGAVKKPMSSADTAKKQALVKSLSKISKKP